MRQTTATSADKVASTGGLDVVDGGAGKMGMDAWAVGVVAAVASMVAL